MNNIRNLTGEDHPHVHHTQPYFYTLKHITINQKTFYDMLY